MDTSKVIPIEEPNMSLGKTCRICMEGEIETSQLLSPCKCSGSIKYIHEECLKTWLVSHCEDLADATCELCKSGLLMEFKMRYKCNPKQSCTSGLNSCMFVPVLGAIVIILFIIVYLLADRYLNSSSGSEEKGYTIALIITCAVSGIILSGLIVTSLKEACFQAKLDDWKIFSQNFSEDEQVEPANLDNWPDSQVLVVPESTKVSGVKVKTPLLNPGLQIIKRRGNMAAYTPQGVTPYMSLIRKTPDPAARSDPMRAKSKSPGPGRSLQYQSIPDDSFNYI